MWSGGPSRHSQGKYWNSGATEYQDASEFHSWWFSFIKGQITWSREESLASALSVEMVDLPVSETEAQFEDEFGAKKGGKKSHDLMNVWLCIELKMHFHAKCVMVFRLKFFFMNRAWDGFCFWNSYGKEMQCKWYRNMSTRSSVCCEKLKKSSRKC